MVKSWLDAGRPVEFHLYQNGGHGFGHLHTSTRIYGETMHSGAGGVPKLVFGPHWVTPEPNDADDLVSILQDRLAVPKP